MTYRRIFTDGRDLRLAEATGEVGPTVMIEVSTTLLAGLLGQRFIGPSGKVISMEQIPLHYDSHVGQCVAEPVIVEQKPSTVDHFCGECALCRL